MSIAATLPVVSPAPADTALIQRMLFAFVPAGGTQKSFLFTQGGNYSRAIEELKRKTVTAGGRIITDRHDILGVDEAFKANADEYGADFMTEFFSKILATGAGRVWLLDPKDATNKARFLTSEFTCTVHITGDMNFDKGAYSQTQLVITPTQEFTWTKDATIS